MTACTGTALNHTGLISNNRAGLPRNGLLIGNIFVFALHIRLQTIIIVSVAPQRICSIQPQGLHLTQKIVRR